jgi:hypothetical protein
MASCQPEIAVVIGIAPKTLEAISADGFDAGQIEQAQRPPTNRLGMRWAL